jgi:hypothetical protein
VEVVDCPEDVAETNSQKDIEFVIIGLRRTLFGEEPSDEEVAVEEGTDEGVFDEAEGVEHVQKFLKD